ncbi:MAG: LysM peptidoglycan-binding domain-containing protein [Ancrocorticia sp.]
MGALEISVGRVVPTRSPKATTLRLVTSEDVERVRQEMAARQATPKSLRERKVAEGTYLRELSGMRLGEPSRKVTATPGYLDMAIRVVGFALAAMVCFVVGLALMDFSSVEPGGSLLVQPGDTLWSVATLVPEAPSVSAAVEDIKELNGLRSDILNVGQGLILPRY